MTPEKAPAQPHASTTLFIVRHTDVHNPNDIFYGRLPRFGLSDLGLEQAERTAAALAGEPVSLFYASPQLRARQTARLLTEAHPGVPVRVSRLLAEVRTAWQGKAHSELEPFHFDFYSNPLHETDETLQALWGRVERFVGRVRRRHAGETLVAVTHGDIVFIAQAGFLKMPLEVRSIRRGDFYPGKGSLTRLVFGPDLSETYPLEISYYDPNGRDKKWSQGWRAL